MVDVATFEEPPVIKGWVPTVDYSVVLSEMIEFDTVFGGRYSIGGTLKINGAPTHRLVRLYEDKSGTLVAETWSDPVDGSYSFPNLSNRFKYTAIGYDYAHSYRAVIADNIGPALT